MNTDYMLYSNIYDVNENMNRNVRDLTILVQDNKNSYSAQLVIAALNEAPGIGLTIAEMKRALIPYFPSTY